MERNDIISAPVVRINAAMYERWHRDHHGNCREFVAFLMTPSQERERFLASLPMTVSRVGSVSMPCYDND